MSGTHVILGGGSSGGTTIGADQTYDGEVSTVPELPDPAANVGLVYRVLNSNGVWPYFSVAGHYKKGFYTSNGTTWTRDLEAEEIQNQIDAASTTDTDRTNHTGFQDISTVTGLQTSLDAKFTQNGNSFGADAVLGTNDNRDLFLKTNNVNRVIVENGGDVGIGTDNPNVRLHVSSTDGSTPTIKIDNEGDTSALRASNFDFAHSGGVSARISTARSSGQTDGMNMKFFTESNSGGGLQEAMRITEDRDVGIGTNTPRTKLHIDGGNATSSALKFTAGTTTGTGSTSGCDFGIDSSGNMDIRQRENLPIRFSTSNAERMRVLGSGNVGIGTSAPSTTLHVNGPARVRQYTTAGVPSASTSGAGSIIYVSNESGGAVMAFSDGTDWRRMTDRAIIS